MEIGTDVFDAYAQIRTTGKPYTFLDICVDNEALYRPGWFDEYSGHGVKIITKEEECITYMAAYGRMHKIKLDNAYGKLFDFHRFEQTINIIDWGCGQATASCCLLDYFRERKIPLKINSIKLIEPSTLSLTSGVKNLENLGIRSYNTVIVALNQKIDVPLCFKYPLGRKHSTIHLFSNILDLETLNLDGLYQNVAQNCHGENYFICVSPTNWGSRKIDQFATMFQNRHQIAKETSILRGSIFKIRGTHIEGELTSNMAVKNNLQIFKINL